MRSLMVIGHDLRIQAAVSALFAKDFLVIACSTGREALSSRPSVSPSLAVIDFSLSELERACAWRAVVRDATGCSVVVTAANRFTAGLPDVDAGRIGSVLSHPFRVADLCSHMTALLKPGPEPLLRRPFLTRAVGEVMEHISHSFQGTLVVSRLAAVACLSSSRLEHVFRERTGQTVTEYLARVRVEAAKRWLLDGRLSLESVATAVGLCDASHLSRVFVRCCGLRPGEYRRRLEAERLTAG